MRPPRLLVATVIVGLAACSVGCTVETGVTQELVVDEPLGAAAVTEVELEMGAGDLTIAPGAVGLASGTIRYNVESWKPTVIRTDKKLSIKQGSQKGVSGLGSEIVNKWDLELGRPPMRLKISAGAYEGLFDLSGLTLQDLSIRDGASRTQVRFNSPNPGQMANFTYKTGASTVTLIGLANANFKSMTFDGGGGDLLSRLLRPAAHRRRCAHQGRRWECADRCAQGDCRPGDHRRHAERHRRRRSVDRRRSDLQHTGRGNSEPG